VVPTTEVCNGIDDDCDGTIDDGVVGPNGEVLGALCCGKGVDMSKCGTGQCEKGTYQCAGNVLVCANAGVPSNELCDNVDNDCNGAVDDITNIGGACEAPGGCSGTLQCNSQQQMLVCVPDGNAGVEVCNGLDDDCDGKVDEIEDVSVNDDWWHDACNQPPVGHDQPPCQPGQFVCKNGEKVCEGDVQPLDREVCDLKDNDCDGIGDTLAACPGTNACVQGVCVEPCHGGEFPCPGGYECNNYEGKNYCVPTTCNDVECPPGAACVDGQCTLTGDGGAGNTPGQGGAGNEPGMGDAGAGNEPGAGGAGEDGGSNGTGNSSGTSGKAGNGAGNQTNEPDDTRGRYGLVTGGGGCSCRTAPLDGGKWALALSLLALGSIVQRRRSSANRRAA
jgi:MYXO-CTERM domain-containing protein